MSYYERYVDKHVGDQIDPELKHEIMKAVINRPLAKIAVPLVVTLGMVIVVVLSIPLFEYAEDTVGIPALVIHGLIVTPMIVGVAFVFLGVIRRGTNARTVLHEELLAAGIHPVKCLYCGYALNQSVSNFCPECGVELGKINDENA